MTTEGSRSAASLLVTIPAALCCWFGALLVAMPVLEPTRDVFVVGPSETLSRLPRVEALLMDTVAGVPRVRGSSAGFVRRLYAEGAWLVLPASEGGCRRSVSAGLRS